jgi:hypothetical protein
VEYIDEERAIRECRVCGRGITGFGQNLRHDGEREPVYVPADPAAADMFNRAVRIGAAAVERLGAGGDAEEEARAVVAALYQDGLLRRRRKAG